MSDLCTLFFSVVPFVVFLKLLVFDLLPEIINIFPITCFNVYHIILPDFPSLMLQIYRTVIIFISTVRLIGNVLDKDEVERS